MTSIRIFAVSFMVISLAIGIGTRPADAQDPLIFLDVEEDIARPGNVVPVSVFIQNLDESIRAFQMGITLNRPDLMLFNADTSIQTCYECSDSACTAVIAYACTVEAVPATAEGSLVENWEYVEARTAGSFDVRITGIADINYDELPPPLPPFTSGILIKVLAQVFCEVDDSLTDRAVVASISPVNTYFSNEVGDLIEPIDLTDGTIIVSYTQRGDMDGSGFHDAVDLGRLIDALFSGGSQGCPSYVSDMNCDGFPDALDLSWLIDYLFAGGPPSPC